MVTGTGAGLELLMLPLDEAVEVEVEVESESCRFINCPGCHLTPAQMLESLELLDA